MAACHDDPTGSNEHRFEIHITPDSAALLVGDTLQLSAVVRDDKGQTVVSSVSWSATDTTVAAISAEGRIVARQVGNTSIIAFTNSVADTARIVVRTLVSGCTGLGVTHTGMMDAETWSVSDSPHFVRDQVIVNRSLIIEAGATVCALPKSSIVVRFGSPLRAIGTSDRHIRFLALDTTAGWGGMSAGGSDTNAAGSITLDYVEMQFASVGAGYMSTASIDHSILRKASAYAGANNSSLTIRNTVIEDGSVQMSAGTFEATTIRRGNLELIYAQPGYPITVNGGRIEDSPGVALTIGSTFSFRVPNVTVVKAPLISGSKGGIALMPPGNFFALWPTAAEQANLLDNPNRTISLWSTVYGDLSLRAGLDWKILGLIGVPVATSLTIEAGASVFFPTNLSVTGAFRALGTAAQPITISSTVCEAPPQLCGFSLKGNATSRLSYVTVNNAYLFTREQNVTQLDHVRTNGPISLGSPGSTITDTEIHDVVARDFFADAALVLGANNVTADRVLVRITGGFTAVKIAGNNIKLLACEVTDNSDDGVVISAGSGIEVHACAIERNGGVGVRNQTSVVVNAQRNWWGDPAGPTGPAGDGIEGLVDFTTPLVARPVSLAPRVARITITRSASSLPTSDTTRFAAIAFDSSGQQIAEPLVWSSSDTSIAFVAPKEDGLVVGAHVGSTTVTVSAVSNLGVQANATLAVTPGAPLYRWTKEPISIDGRASSLSASSLNTMYAVGHRNPPSGTSDTCCLLHREGTVWNAAPNVTVTRAGLLSVAPTGQVFIESNDSIAYYDGTSFRRLAPMPTANRYQLAATGPDEVYIAGDRGRLWRYRNGSVELVLSDSMVANAGVWARSANEVYFFASDFNVQPPRTRVFKWDGQSWKRLPDLPGYGSPISADDRYAYGGGYRFTGTQWELLPGNSVGNSYIAYTSSDSFIVLQKGWSIYLYDGQQIRTLWAGEKLGGITGLWTVGNEIFIASGRDFILHGRPE